MARTPAGRNADGDDGQHVGGARLGVDFESVLVQPAGELSHGRHEHYSLQLVAVPGRF